MFLQGKNLKKLFLVLVVSAVIIGGLFYFRLSVSAFFLNKGIEEYVGKNLSLARNYLNLAKLADAKNPIIYSYLGRIYVAGSQYILAEDNFITALDLGVKDKDKKIYYDTLYGLAYTYEKLSQLEKAVNYYKEAIALYPNKPLISQYRVAFLNYQNLNRPEEATQLLEQLSSLIEEAQDTNVYEGDQAAVFNLLARLYLFSGDSKLAIDSAKKGIELIEFIKVQKELDSEKQILLTSLRLNLASALGQGGQLTVAEKELEILRKDGKDISADCALAEIYAVYAPKKNYKKAVEIVELLLKEGKNIVFSAGFPDRACRSALSWGYIKTGQTGKAVEAIKQYRAAFVSENQSSAMKRDLENLEKELALQEK